MSDYSDRYTDKKISEVDRALKKTYRTAQTELKKKLADFNKRFNEKSRKKKQQVKDGEITEQEYKDWLTGQVFIRNQWQSQINAVNSVLLDHNKQAIKIINNGTLDVFAESYNFNAFRAESEIVASFTLYNAESVARLILGDPQLLPEWKIDKKKDYVWNYDKVNNIVRQAIIQGKNIEEITGELCSRLSTANDNKMRMFARTALGSAQNAGRQKQMEDAAEMGIEVEKEWEAAHDDRTRDSHRALDGERVPYDKPFSNGLMFPKDPTGAPEEVYNCRCTMKTIYPKYEDRTKPDWRENEVINGKSYREWKKFDNYAEWKKWKEETGQVKRKTNAERDEVANVKPSYYTSIEKMLGMTSEQEKAINDRFIELDRKYHANVDGGVHGLLERDQAEYDLEFDNYYRHLLEENPKMRKSTAERKTREIMGERPEYTPGHGSMRYIETGGEYRERDNLYTMLQNRDNWQDFRHTITINPYSLGADSTLEDDIASRIAHAERNAQRIAEGRNPRSLLNVGSSLEGTFIHEYGHAIDYTYGISTNPAFIDFYKGLTEDEIRSISRYAETNEKEFIAEAFYESFMGETQGEISKKFMKILEDIIK